MNDSINEFHMRMIPVVGRIVKECLLRDGLLSSDNHAKSSSFLLELLRGRRAAELMLPNSQLLGITIPKHYVCICVYFRPVLQYTNAQKLEIRTRMLSAVNDSLVAGFDGNLVFMTKTNEGLYNDYAEIEPSLTKIAQEYKLRIALSNIFSSPLDFKHSYEQAKECILIAEQMKLKGNVYRYSQTSYYSILNMANDNESLNLSVHPIIRVLESYDKENGTQFLETLKVYILCSLSIKKTIETLHMHRNTFDYQLKRIIELTGIDFYDDENMFYLSCSIRIFEYLKRK